LTIILFIALLGLVITPAPTLAGGKGKHWHPRSCSKTASSAYLACQYEVRDDYWIAKGNCYNEEEDQAECFAEAKEAYKEAKEECWDQLEARKEVCELVGEEPYDPAFTEFEYRGFPIPEAELNLYFPLTVGNRWVYKGVSEDDDGELVYEKDTVEVIRATKLIEGVSCIVVNDVVEECEEEDLQDCTDIEDTDDWYAQIINGDVWYFGEIAKNFETSEGDNPPVPELVDIEGSWKTGRDGAKPGLLIEADPQLGNAYRQEMLLGEAEDVAEILSVNYVFGEEEEYDEQVPEDLANELCGTDPSSSSCVVTRELSALEPGVEELKYYAPGIGVFLEVNLETGETVRLVECNVDIKCGSLPVP
jgi:hypothetical protein